MKPKMIIAVLAASLALTSVSHADKLEVEVESGAVWFSRNDTRIDGETGTRLNMLDLTGDGPDAYVRVYATYTFNPKHALRLTYAPLEAEGTGQFDQDVLFDGTLFPANTDTKGTYQFNTYRLTYRYTFYESENLTLGGGLALLVRDANIALEQADRRENDDNLGLVPLLHLYGAYQVDDNLSVVLDIEGAAASQGRAVDAALKVRYDFDSDWHVSAGYRTLEGGADNDDVYTFAWIHYAMLAAGYSF